MPPAQLKSFTAVYANYTSVPLHYPQAVTAPTLHRKTKRPEPLEGDDPTLTKRTLDFKSKDPSSKNQSKNPSKNPSKDQSKNPSKNPFELKDNHLDKFKDYILCRQPWNPPSKYRAMGDFDDPASYQAKKRSMENAIPSIAEAAMLLIPAIVRHKSYEKHLLTVDFAQSHKEILSKICALLSGSDWEGIYLLLPRPNMNYPSYGKGTKPQAGLSYMEALRRIWRLEESNETMTKYMDAAIKGGQKSLRLIAARHLADAYAVLNHSNLDSRFADSIDLVLKVVPSAKIASPLLEQLEWLKDNRKSLNTPYPVLTELDWGVPILALIHSLLGSLKQLESEIEAQTVLATIMAFLDKRASIHTKVMEPILLYGAQLAQHTAALQTLCFNFTGLGSKGNVPFTQAGRFHELDRDGKLLGTDGRVNSLGLDALIPGREKWLLPFPVECIAIVIDPELDEICKAHLEEEKLLVSSMLSDLNLQPIPPLLSYMAAGHSKVKEILSSESSPMPPTSILPPTASMPSAWYAPDVVFGGIGSE